MGSADSRLWLSSLADIAGDGDNIANIKSRLRHAYSRFREQSKVLARQIEKDLPGYAVHDISHSDALWDMVSIIAGENLLLNPTEAFILGGAFLIHDLGLAVAAYPDGVNKLREYPIWQATAKAELISRKMQAPDNLNELTLPQEVINVATEATLRALHADRASELAMIPLNGNYLLEDNDLRNTYGSLIGRIAASHWWQIDKVGNEFSTIGAYPGWPVEWKIDPLTLACLLRVADACHLDARRAPLLERIIRKPNKTSEDYWTFQQHIQTPHIETNRLCFTSAKAFSADESSAWWLGYDHLKAADRELRQTNSLLADKGRSQFAVREIAGIDDPIRLSEYIRTDGWTPVDVQVKVSSIPAIASKLGGEQLYGRNPIVPLRELIQNATDAIRARREITGKPDHGSIIVRLGRDGDKHWLEVEDDGVGMSTDILTGPFLDFGSSFWGTMAMFREFPELANKSIRSTGKFGIGFFSVFMLGKRVNVTTCNFKQDWSRTQVLQFDNGLDSRPLLRQSKEDEIIHGGGTKVRVWLDIPPDQPYGLLKRQHNHLFSLCAWLCPALDVDLYVQEYNNEPCQVIHANDWLTMNNVDLIKRFTDIGHTSHAFPSFDIHKVLETMGSNLRPIVNANGETVGKACIVPSEKGLITNYASIVTVGGLNICYVNHVAGIFVGDCDTASRNCAIPIADDEALAKWSSEQASLVKEFEVQENALHGCAYVISQMGGNTGDLPLAHTSCGLMSFDAIASKKDWGDYIIISEVGIWYDYAQKDKTFICNDNVIGISSSRNNLISSEAYLSSRNSAFFWPDMDKYPPRNTSPYYCKCGALVLVIKAIAKAWGVTIDDVLSTFNEKSGRDVGSIGSVDGEPIVYENRMFIIEKPS